MISTVTGGVSASALGKSPNPTTAMSAAVARCKAWTRPSCHSVVAENPAGGVRRLQELTSQRRISRPTRRALR